MAKQTRAQFTCAICGDAFADPQSYQEHWDEEIRQAFTDEDGFSLDNGNANSNSNSTSKRVLAPRGKNPILLDGSSGSKRKFFENMDDTMILIKEDKAHGIKRKAVSMLDRENGHCLEQEDGEKHCPICGAFFPFSDELERHVQQEMDEMDKALDLTRKKCREEPCPFCNVKVPLNRLQQHVACCEKDIMAFEAEGLLSKSLIYEGDGSSSSSGGSRVTCPLCNVAIPSNEIDKHVNLEMNELEYKAKIERQVGNKNRHFEVQQPLGTSKPSRILVIGDDPCPRTTRNQKLDKANARQEQYNHYADADDAWWDGNELSMSWEGIAATSFGADFDPPL